MIVLKSKNEFLSIYVWLFLHETTVADLAQDSVQGKFELIITFDQIGDY